MSTDDLTDFDKMSWCISNNINIFPKPIGDPRGERRPLCKIIVHYNGKPIHGKEEYKQDAKLYEKILELYCHYYDKRKGKEAANRMDGNKGTV